MGRKKQSWLMKELTKPVKPGYKHPSHRPPTRSSKKSQGCYIATSVYGSYDCQEVWVLRRFRDATLAQSWYGRAFIKVYYAISPTIVKWFGNKQLFTKIWKMELDRIVRKLKKQGIENTPYKDQ